MKHQKIGMQISGFAILTLAITSCTTVQFEATSRGEKLTPSRMKSDLRSIVHSIGDRNGDGEMTFTEAKKVHPTGNKARFSKADTNKSGGLSSSELGLVMWKAGSYDSLISGTDLNNDGVIDARETEIYLRKIKAARKAKTYAQLGRIMDATK